MANHEWIVRKRYILCILFDFYSKTKYFVVETWILFRKNELKELVSNVILEAYQHYEAMEFGRDEKIDNPDRHIKLINISGKKVR